MRNRGGGPYRRQRRVGRFRRVVEERQMQLNGDRRCRYPIILAMRGRHIFDINALDWAAKLNCELRRIALFFVGSFAVYDSGARWDEENEFVGFVDDVLDTVLPIQRIALVGRDNFKGDRSIKCE